MNAALKPEIFAVVWVDRMLGNLTLHKDDRAAAIEAAASIRERGAGKVDHVHAVHIAAGSDSLAYLD